VDAVHRHSYDQQLHSIGTLLEQAAFIWSSRSAAGFGGAELYITSTPREQNNHFPSEIYLDPEFWQQCLFEARFASVLIVLEECLAQCWDLLGRDSLTCLLAVTAFPISCLGGHRPSRQTLLRVIIGFSLVPD
jgi:hypothetical protein